MSTNPVRVVVALRDINDLNSLQGAIYQDPQQRVSVVGIAPTAETFQQNTLDLRPDVVVADARFALDIGEQRFLAFLQNLPSSTVAVVTLPQEFAAMEGKLRAMRDRVKEVTPTPFNPAALLDRIAEIGWAQQAIRRELAAASGTATGPMAPMATPTTPTLAAQKVIVVAGFKGGPGKTTISVNLWQFLNRHWGRAIAPSLLIGLDIPDDTVAQLGLAPTATVTNFLARPNEMGLTASIVKSSDGYPVICSPEDPGEVMEYAEKAPDLLRALLYTARSQELLGIVVDVPPGYSDWTIEPMAMASLVLLVIEPDPANVRKAVMGLRALERYTGIDRRKINLVVNKVPTKSPVTAGEVQEQIRNALGRDVPVIGVIPYDVSVHVNQVQFRVPVSADPETPFSQAIERLALALYPGLAGARPRQSGGLAEKVKSFLRRI